MGSSSSTSTTSKQQGWSQLEPYEAIGGRSTMTDISKWTGDAYRQANEQMERLRYPMQLATEYTLRGGNFGQGREYLGNAAGMLGSGVTALNQVPYYNDVAAQYLGSGAGLVGSGAGWLTGTGMQGMEYLSPIASGQGLDTQNPYLQGLLGTIQDRITNQVGGQFAAAGRDFSGAYANALGSGMSAGLAAPLFQNYQNEQQRQMEAINAMNNLGVSVGGGLGNLGTSLGGLGVDYGNLGTNYMNLAGQYGNLASGYQGLTQSYDQIEQNKINAMLAGAGLGGQAIMMPFQPVTGYENLLLPISTAFGRNVWNQTAQEKSKTSTSMFSDRRLKEDIEEVGTLFDGTPIYRFRFKDMPTTLIGLMADDVEKRAPEAVTVGAYGFKRVDYKLATEASVKKD